MFFEEPEVLEEPEPEPYFVCWRKFMLALALIMITMLALLVPTMKKIRRVIAACDEVPSTVGSIDDYLPQEVQTTTASNFPGHDADVQLVAPKNVPQEALVTKPVHCTYHCRQAPGTPIGFPPDGLCDFVYFQNPKELSLAEYGKSGCATLMTTSAAKAQKTLYGISVYITTAENNEKELRTTAGLTKFKELWDSNVTCHGVNFHITQPDELAKFEGYSFLKRVWYLQRVMAGLSDKMWLVPYNLAGVYVVSNEYSKERKTITQVLTRLSRNYKINLLVLNTHSMKYAQQIPYQPLQGQRCTVAGPTASNELKGSTELSLVEAKDLLKHVTVPGFVRVMVSFSAAAHEFSVVAPSSTTVYGAECTSQEFVPYEVTCTTGLENRKHEETPNVETAIRRASAKRVVWELATGILDKANRIQTSLSKIELGFSVDHMECAYVSARAPVKCPGLADYPIVSAVRNFTGKTTP